MMQPKQESENKMTIVVVKGQLSKSDECKLISQAVIKAYEQACIKDYAAVQRWENNSWPKICLQCDSVQAIQALYDSAKDTLVYLHARNEVPVVLVVGPGQKSQIDSITGKLRLL